MLSTSFYIFDYWFIKINLFVFEMHGNKKEHQDHFFKCEKITIKYFKFASVVN